MGFTATPSCARTTGRQHDISIWPQSPGLLMQQSISGCVSVWPGMKHATSGATPQNSATVMTNARIGCCMCEVYTAVPTLGAFRGCLIQRTELNLTGFAHKIGSGKAPLLS